MKKVMLDSQTEQEFTDQVCEVYTDLSNDAYWQIVDVAQADWLDTNVDSHTIRNSVVDIVEEHDKARNLSRGRVHLHLAKRRWG